MYTCGLGVTLRVDLLRCAGRCICFPFFFLSILKCEIDMPCECTAEKATLNILVEISGRHGLFLLVICLDGEIFLQGGQRNRKPMTTTGSTAGNGPKLLRKRG